VERRWFVRKIAPIVAVAIAACSASPTPRYEPADLHAIELRAADAPRGLGYVRRYSGDQGLDAFARDDGERAALASDGFELGSGALFVPADRVAKGNIGVRDPIVQGTVAVFSRDDGASASLARYLDDLRERQLQPIPATDPEPLGDETYRISALNGDGATVTVIGWRRANLVLVVIGTSFAPSSVEALARLVDARAASVA
jgi:hypothetical protein